MRLRTKLILVGLVTLVLPWSAWRYLQETEQFLRAGEERALLAAARVLAQAVARDYQAAPWARGWYVQTLAAAPAVDGYGDDWQASDGFRQALGEGVTLRLGQAGEDLYLLLSVTDPRLVYGRPPVAADRVKLSLLTPARRDYLIASEAPGWVEAVPAAGGAVLRGEWQETADGYSLELRIPGAPALAGLGLAVVDAGAGGERLLAASGAAQDPARPRPLTRPLPPAALRTFDGAPGRGWLIDADGWVLGRRGDLQPAETPDGARWPRTLLYRYLIAPPLGAGYARTGADLRLAGPEIATALSGREAVVWLPDGGTVVASAAVPVTAAGRVVGAVVVEQAGDLLLVLTNRALGRLASTTLAAFAAALLVLFLFASRLSLRIRRLRDAAEAALAPQAEPATELPLARDGDELGDLSRSFSRSLAELRSYTDYLRGLAGKLSHELRTPLAVVGSSLENLAQAGLPAQARPYLQRAREGNERLGRILRAMSEAHRLEASLAREEGEAFDLAELVRGCGAGYRGIAGDRRIEVEVERGDFRFFGAPELLVQLLDKLVDNALGFAPAGGWVRIGLRRDPAGVELSVANGGPLLPERMRNRLFESMVSVRDGEGGEPHLGLGLYIVRLIAERHGGGVSAANLPAGDGVVFRVRLRGLV